MGAIFNPALCIYKTLTYFFILEYNLSVHDVFMWRRFSEHEAFQCCTLCYMKFYFKNINIYSPNIDNAMVSVLYHT